MALRIVWRGRVKATIVPTCQWDRPSPSSRNDVAIPSSQRHVSSLVKKGSGGRSSFSGIVATVFGATGFVGRYVVNRLGRMGSQVIVPYRGDEYDFRHLRVMGDLGQILFPDYSIRDRESVRKMVEHSNVVINLVGRDYETRNFSFNDVHVEGARVIAEACAECGVTQLIHFSALSADQQSPSTFLQSKALGEDVVKEAFPDAVIVRPSDIYGNEDRFLKYYARLRLLPFGMVPVLRRGEGVMKRPVFVGDIAGGVVQLINEGASGTTYEFTGPKEYELPDLIQYFYGVMYRSCRMVAPHPVIFNAIAYLLEQSPFIPYLTRDVLRRQHFSDIVTRDAPGLEDLGVTPTFLEDKAIATLRMYRDFFDMQKPIEETHPSHQK